MSLATCIRDYFCRQFKCTYIVFGSSLETVKGLTLFLEYCRLHLYKVNFFVFKESGNLGCKKFYFLRLRKKCPNTEILFWSLFSHIWTEYGDLLRKSPYSFQMQENTDQKRLLIWTFFVQFTVLLKGISRKYVRYNYGLNLVAYWLVALK